MTHRSVNKPMTAQSLAREHQQSLERFARAWGLGGAVGGGYSSVPVSVTQEGDQNEALVRYGRNAGDHAEMTEVLGLLDKLVELLI